jgi:hypothetical protein
VNIRDELVKLQRDIEEHADDTCWCGPAETVVDRIEWMLQQYSAAKAPIRQLSVGRFPHRSAGEQLRVATGLRQSHSGIE